MRKKPVVLTIAGSDSGAGAGIQSDLKTFHNHGVYGITAITAITSQNTKGVQSSFEIPAGIITSQLKSLFDDFNIRIVKTGMLSSSKTIDAVHSVLKSRMNLKLIVDPVIFSKNGFQLLDRRGIQSLITKLLPLSYLITPNFFEAEAITGLKIETVEDLESACEVLHEMGTKHVIIKGGHMPGSIGLPFGSDLLLSNRKYFIFPGTYVRTRHTHGIGCTFSAAIAANLAAGKKLEESIIEAKVYVQKRLREAQKIGKGINPVEQ